MNVVYKRTLMSGSAPNTLSIVAISTICFLVVVFAVASYFHSRHSSPPPTNDVEAPASAISNIAAVEPLSRTNTIINLPNAVHINDNSDNWSMQTLVNKRNSVREAQSTSRHQGGPNWGPTIVYTRNITFIGSSNL